MILNGSYLAIIVGAWLSYKLACWLHDRAEAKR